MINIQQFLRRNHGITDPFPIDTTISVYVGDIVVEEAFAADSVSGDGGEHVAYPGAFGVVPVELGC